MAASGSKVLGLSLAGLAAIALACAAVLFFFDPARVAIYPVCYFHQITGLNCPGCGGLRAAHQLLHGNVAAAFRLNAFVVVAVPVFAWLCVRAGFCALKQQPVSFKISSGWLWSGLVLLLIYGVLRNFV